MENLQRLQKVIANYGLCSRRKAEKLIINKKIKVNEKIITKLGFKVKNNDIIKFNNKIIKNLEYIYLAFFKPRYCLTTVYDSKNRPTVMDYLNNIKIRIYPVGRLDFDCSGLLLITNDGKFHNIIAHPSYKIKKKYEVLINNILTLNHINQLQKGVILSPLFTSSPAIVKIIYINLKKRRTLIHLTIHEGKNKQIKRMIEAIGNKVIKLKRLQIANINLNGLKIGQYRHLTDDEVKFLLNINKNK